ncbi:MAG: nuclear transport factor 2 family protein [Steroidobacteraceae bacterium]
MLNYDDYIAVFNSGDDAALLERFFAADVVFTGGSRDYQGKAALRAFLDWAHDGVREVMRPQNVIRREDMIFADVDMDFHASKPRPDFPFGAMRPGDLITVKFFVTYRLRGDRVVELKSMTWPPGKGVTSVPRLGPHPSQIAAFGAYVSAFSQGEFERFARFYTEDVRLELGSIPPIQGRQGIIDFYRPMFASVSEKLRINTVTATETTIELDAVTRFTAITDAPDFVVAPMRAGEYVEGRVLVSYELRGGLIARISVRRGGEMLKHPRAD